MNRTRTIEHFKNEAISAIENANAESILMMNKPDEKYHLLNAQYHLGEYHAYIKLLDRFCPSAMCEIHNKTESMWQAIELRIEAYYYGGNNV